MKLFHQRSLVCLLTAAVLSASPLSLSGQTVVTVNTFANANEVSDSANGGANAWGNWFGTAFYQAIWSSSDASNNPASGSLRVEAYFPDSGIGGQFGPQFLAQNGFNGINPPIVGNGSTSNVLVATNLSFDIRFDPQTDLNGSTNWPTIEVGTGGGSLNQYYFGSFTLPASQTNWVRVSVPIAPSANWTNIPHVFFKHYSDTRTNWVVFHLDNIQFKLGNVETPPPGSPPVVIGSWQDNDGDGWIDWGNQASITNTANTNKYQFVSGAVAGYSQSLQIGQPGYNQNLAIKLHELPGGVAAFLTNHLLSFTFSVPSAAASGSTAGYSQLYAVAVNASGYGFNDQSFTNLTTTGDTANNQGNQPNFYFYSGATARSQVVTLNYSNILSAITATPSSGYIELIFTFNNGGGAPTNYFINNVALSGANTSPPPPPSSTNVVIGSWQDNDGDGWIDWGNQASITNTVNTNKYRFVSGAVAGYPQSLQIGQAGYNQNLAIKLHELPGGVAAFLTNHLLSFTFSVPSAAATGSTAGYSQLYALSVNASGYGFNDQATSRFTATGDTNNNNGWQPNFNFYSGAPARSQVVTLNYSNILSAITATPSSGYIELIFTFNNGGGAATNYFINNVALSGGSVTASPNPPTFTAGGVSVLPGGAISLTATGAVNTPYRLWASTNVALSPVTNTWTLISNGTVTVSPFTITDSAATNFSRRFYLFSSP